MRLTGRRLSPSLRRELTTAAKEALAAARLTSVMRNGTIYVAIGRGSGRAGIPSYSRRANRVVSGYVDYAPNLTTYTSYPLKRLPPFRITGLTPTQRWALVLVHEATHVKQGQIARGWSELAADRSILKAQATLGWGTLTYIGGSS